MPYCRKIPRVVYSKKTFRTDCKGIPGTGILLSNKAQIIPKTAGGIPRYPSCIPSYLRPFGSAQVLFFRNFISLSLSGKLPVLTAAE